MSELNEGHLTEALDRVHIAGCFFDEHVLEHVLIDATPEFKIAADKISSAIADLYQTVGKYNNLKEVADNQ